MYAGVYAVYTYACSKYMFKTVVLTDWLDKTQWLLGPHQK